MATTIGDKNALGTNERAVKIMGRQHCASEKRDSLNNDVATTMRNRLERELKHSQIHDHALAMGGREVL